MFLLLNTTIYTIIRLIDTLRCFCRFENFAANLKIAHLRATASNNMAD